MSLVRTTGILRRAEQLGQQLSIKIVFPNQFRMFGGILLKKRKDIYIN